MQEINAQINDVINNNQKSVKRLKKQFLKIYHELEQS